MVKERHARVVARMRDAGIGDFHTERLRLRLYVVHWYTITALLISESINIQIVCTIYCSPLSLEMAPRY